MFLYEMEKLKSNYITDGTRFGFYSYGVFWNLSERENPRSSLHIGFLIGRGAPEEVGGGSDAWDEPPIIEPVEYEWIVVRPRLKYPKRDKKQKERQINDKI